MIGLIFKTSSVLFAALVISCAVNESVVQNRTDSNKESVVQNNSGSNIAVNQTVAPPKPSATPATKNKTPDYFAHIKPEHREVLQEWLKSKKYLRPAVEEIDNLDFQESSYEDKENFRKNYEGNMKFLRETVGANGYQYYSVGDMNQDGKVDFAVLLVDSRKKEGEDDYADFALAIFNAPFKQGQSPAYYEENLSGVTNSYIVFDLMTKKHLFLGKLESDVYCATYYPKGKTYYFKDCM